MFSFMNKRSFDKIWAPNNTLYASILGNLFQLHQRLNSQSRNITSNANDNILTFVFFYFILFNFIIIFYFIIFFFFGMVISHLYRPYR